MSVMRLTRISAKDFLALPSLDLTVDNNLTVITGANGVGKSTVLAACSLAKDAMAAAVAGDTTQLDTDWASACRDDGVAFEVRVTLAFDRGDERTLLDHFVVAALLPLLHATAELSDRTETVLTKILGTSPADALTRGTLVVGFDAIQRYRWIAGWEFALPHGVAHIGLLGPTVGELTDGAVSYERTDASRRDKLATQTNDLLTKLEARKIPVKLDEIVPGHTLEFRVQPTGDRREPSSIQAVLAASGKPRPGDGILFSRVLDSLFTRRLLVTPNHRKRPRSKFSPDELIKAPDLADGSMLAVELHRLKNGDAAARAQFRMVQERMMVLTGQSVDCRQMTTGGNSDLAVHLTPVLQGRSKAGASFDVPLERAGAGVSEALYLSAVLADERHVVLLDEPAVHLSPTSQRRLLTLLRSQGHARQVVMVTHNPDVVPVRNADDLSSIVRLSRSRGEVRTERLPKESLEQPDRTVQLLASPGLRSVLFAAGVVLCEGPTDVTVLRSWTDRTMTNGGKALPTNEDSNIVFFSVDGQTAFVSTIQFLRSMGIPWAVVADGPALRPEGPLARYVRTQQLAEIPKGDRLDEVREAWERAGVYTLAATFGDDGTKSGEIEAFLETVDAAAFQAAQRSVGAKKGPRVGAAFAAQVDPPAAIKNLWEQICNHVIDSHPL
ncbi:AAA family ATPase [Kribbella sp. NPDC023855]|uniref:AAA family ATPase n=1 Tax=Kribbella sp. NPDC023855 TaxID=3154698 RepID=UPI0033FCFDF5